MLLFQLLCIVDFTHDVTIGNIIHDSKINWLEVSVAGDILYSMCISCIVE